MKRFSPQVGGHDLKLDDFVLMQTAYTESFRGLLSAVAHNGTAILQGVEMTSSFGTSTLDFTAGWVGFNYEVFRVFFTSLPMLIVGGGGSRPFLKIKETVMNPPSPVVYEDSVSKNVHYERIMIIKYFNSADGDINMVNGIYFDELPYHSAMQRGMVTEWYPTYFSEENDLFDSNGLGRKRMKGYAICNGLNNTPDLRGLFTIMPSVNMKNSAGLHSKAISGVAITNVIGKQDASILQANLPDYNLLVTDPGHRHPEQQKAGNAKAGGAGQHAVSSFINEPNKYYTESATTGISVRLNGGSTPLATVSPAYAMIKIMRIL